MNDDTSKQVPPSQDAPQDVQVEHISPINNPETLDSKPVQNFSAVASSLNSKRMTIIGFIIVLIGATYFLMSSVTSNKKVELSPAEKIKERSEAEAKKLIKEAKPAPQAEITPPVVAPSKALEVPAIQVPKPPEPPPLPLPIAPQSPMFPASNKPVVGGVPISPATPFVTKVDPDLQKALEARRRASIMLLSGGGGIGKGAAGVGKEGDGKNKDDKAVPEKKPKVEFLGFGGGTLGESSLAQTAADQVRATTLGNLSNTIAQGKVINAILETAINSDLPGMLRAIITRDVYAEAGTSILIPKGSRVIGSYAAQVKAGQTRIAVVWSRVIRPDGVDIAIDSPATDKLGRAGVDGFLDDKLLTKLSNAFLISYIVPIIANKLAGVKKDEQVTTSTTTNAATGVSSSTTSSSFEAQQQQESAKQFKDIMSKAIEESFNTKPTLFIDQGTEINIFVNKDFIFPNGTEYSKMKILN